MYYLPVFWIGRRRLLDAVVVCSDCDGAPFGEKLCAGAVNARRVGHIGIWIWPCCHATGPHHNDVARAQLAPLMLQAALQVFSPNAIARRQHLDAVHTCDVEQQSSRYHRRMLFCAVHVPMSAAKMIESRVTVEDFAVVAEVV